MNTSFTPRFSPIGKHTSILGNRRDSHVCPTLTAHRLHTMPAVCNWIPRPIILALNMVLALSTIAHAPIAFAQASHAHAAPYSGGLRAVDMRMAPCDEPPVLEKGELDTTDEMPIGCGFDPFIGTRMADGFAITDTAELPTPASGGYRFLADVVYKKSLSELVRSRSTSIAAQLGYGPFSGDMMTEYLRDTRTSRNSQYLYIHASLRYDIPTGSRYQLGAQALAVIDTNPGEIYERFGVSYVSGIRMGGDFDCVVEILNVDSQSEESLDTKFSAGGGIGKLSFDASAELVSLLKSISKEYETHMTLLRRGGDVGPQSGEIDSLIHYVVREFPDDVDKRPARIGVIYSSTETLVKARVKDVTAASAAHGEYLRMRRMRNSHLSQMRDYMIEATAVRNELRWRLERRGFASSHDLALQWENQLHMAELALRAVQDGIVRICDAALPQDDDGARDLPPIPDIRGSGNFGYDAGQPGDRLVEEIVGTVVAPTQYKDPSQYDYAVIRIAWDNKRTVPVWEVVWLGGIFKGSAQQFDTLGFKGAMTQRGDFTCGGVYGLKIGPTGIEVQPVDNQSPELIPVAVAPSAGRAGKARSVNCQIWPIVAKNGGFLLWTREFTQSCWK